MMKVKKKMVEVLMGWTLVSPAVGLLRMPAGPVDRPVTYSNPFGASLTEVRESVWLAERPFYPRLPGLQGTDVACKATVIRLQSGGLWVHAPVALDAGTRAAVDALGVVEDIVSPNAEHVSFAAEWIEAYPEARAYAAPLLRARFPHIPWQADVPPTPDAWNDEFDAVWIDAERVPLLGRGPFFSEVVFCHRPSRCLMVTDLWWNYPTAHDSPARLPAPRAWKAAMDYLYRPVYNNILRVRPRHDQIMDRILDLDFDCILPCHGEPIAGPHVKDLLRAFLDLPPPPK